MVVCEDRAGTPAVHWRGRSLGPSPCLRAPPIFPEACRPGWAVGRGVQRWLR